MLANLVVGIGLLIFTMGFFWWAGHDFNKEEGTTRSAYITAGIITGVLSLLFVFSFGGAVGREVGYLNAKSELKLSYSIDNHIELVAGDKFSEIILESASNGMSFRDCFENALTEYIRDNPLASYYEGTVLRPNDFDFNLSLIIADPRTFHTDWYTAEWHIDKIYSADDGKIVPGVMWFKCVVSLEHRPTISLDEESYSDFTPDGDMSHFL